MVHIFLIFSIILLLGCPGCDGDGSNNAPPPNLSLSCTEGQSETRSCGLNNRGTQTRQCVNGFFDVFGTCTDPDVCKDGITITVSCGLNNRGQQTGTCAAGNFGPFGTCSNSDVCSDGATETQNCGFGNAGRQTRTCASGQWQAFGACQIQPRIEQVVAGGNRTCLLLNNGTVRCAGEAILSQNLLGTTNTGSFTEIPGIATVLALAVRNSHACVVLENGRLNCWGENALGQLGNGTNIRSITPVEVSGITTATAVVVGLSHSCALLRDGTIRCWGGNARGHLGNGNRNNSNIPVEVTGITNAMSLFAGDDHTCALLSNGAIQCWGSGGISQLGNGNTTDSTQPVNVTGITNATALSMGSSESHTCALLANGSVRCWGYNSLGQLGDGKSDDSAIPVAVSGLSSETIRQIVLGHEFTCILFATGRVQCWGDNYFGQIGIGPAQQLRSPQFVDGISTGMSLAAGYRHACSLIEDRTLRCWGNNQLGQLGNGRPLAAVSPLQVPGIGVTRIAVGSNHACSFEVSGTVSCWGYNLYGQLGNSTVRAFDWSTTPIETSSRLSTTLFLKAQKEYTCALLTSGQIQCWGLNNASQLGSGTSQYSSNIPLVVSNISTARNIALGEGHACALLADSTVRCWGLNTSGQLGNGSSGIVPLAPVVVSGLTGVNGIALGIAHSCAVLSNGSVRCWGLNRDGQLGNNTTINSPTAVAVIGIPTAGGVNAVAIAAGGNHTCAALSDGTLRCWGLSGPNGLLGNGSTTSSSIPVQVLGITAVKDVVAGVNHNCALSVGDVLQCWGSNLFGQLGNTTNNVSLTPTTISSVQNIQAIAVGESNTCVTRNNGSLFCWGLNRDGQLGDGKPILHVRPTEIRFY